MAVFFIFGSSLEFFVDKKFFVYFRLFTLICCLPLTSCYLLFNSPENGIHFLTLIISLFIMVLIADDKHKNAVISIEILFLVSILLMMFMGKQEFVLEKAFHVWHIFYLIGFVFVALLIKSSMQTLLLEKDLAVVAERYRVAKNISHDVTTPLLALKLLLEDDKDLSSRRRKIMFSSITEVSKIIDNIVPGISTDYNYLSLKNINSILENCVKKREKHLGVKFNLNFDDDVIARVEPVSFGRVFTELIGIYVETIVPNSLYSIVIETRVDDLGNVIIKIKLANGRVTQENLSKIIERHDIIGKDSHLGLQYSDIEDTIKRWRGEISIGSERGVAFMQVILPGQSNDEIIR